MTRKILLLAGLIQLSQTGVVSAQADSTSQCLELEVIYSALPWYNTTGGLHTGMVYMDNLDLTAKINFDAIFKMREGLSLFVYGLGNHGGAATSLMGDLQVASNIEANRSWRLFEIWAQHNFLGDRLSVLAGWYDLNSEFDILRPGTLFINSSFGIGAEYAQSGVNGPSIFPVASFGARLATFIGRRTRVRVAVLDAAPGRGDDPKRIGLDINRNDGALVAAEVAVYTGSHGEDAVRTQDRVYTTRRRKVGREFEVTHNDKINVGWWWYTAQFPQINDSTDFQRGNMGLYAGAQKYFPLRSEDAFLSVFLRYGIAHPNFNRFGSAVSGGVVLANGLAKPGDRLGFAFTSAINGHVFASSTDQPLAASETALELTYALPIKPWILLQPDLQYIINPATRRDLRNPLSVSLLVQISLGPVGI